MRSTWYRALFVSFVLIMSSLAGCLGGDEEEEELEEGQYGSVMVSTYHIGELVSAIAGDTLKIDYMSQDNTPVHDYEPEPEDMVRLGNSDIFFYHGLGLEPWVDDKISELGDDAPRSIEVHTMPSGEISLDFEFLLVDKLCSSLSEPSAEVIHMLAEHAEDAEELHGDDGVYNFAFPEDDHDEDHDEDHGEHDHDEDHDEDHGDHGDDHDEHDHGEHTMVMPEDDLTPSSDCPSGTVISVYHLEAGEYMLEFEGDEEVETFKMAIAAMGGAHHHHHHGHGDGAFEWAGVFEMNDDTHTWSMQKVGGDYADPTMRLVLIPTDTPTEETMHGLEGGVEALMEGDCTVVEDGETMSSIAADGSCFELHVGTGDDSMFTIDTAGITGMAMYAQHVPTEFERDQHYLKDSAGTDIEPIAQEGAGAHDHGDHDDHGNDGDHDDHGDEMTAEEAMEMFDENNDSYLSLEEFLEGMESMEDDHDDHDHHDEHDHDENHTDDEHDHDDNHTDDDHDDHWTPNTCHDTDTHETHDEYTNKEDCEAAGYMWMDEDDHHDHDDHDLEHEFEEAFFGHFFNEADADGDGLLDMTELGTLADTMNNMEDDIEMDLMVEIYISIFDEDEDEVLSLSEFTEMMEEMRSMDEDDHDDHDDHAHDHEDEMVCYNISTHTIDESHTNEADCEAAGLMWTENQDDDHDDHDDEMNVTEMAEVMFNMSDANDDGYLDESELHTMFEEMEEGEHEEGVAFIGLHVEEEGEYGIALPEGVELHLLMAGGHEGHDHGSHDDHDDHGDDHDDHGDEDGDSDGDDLKYDPHSWLDPVAYAAQVDLVLQALIDEFPDGEDTFKKNANAFKAELIELDEKFQTLADNCNDRTVVANHNAYSYLAYRYDIDFVTVHGLDPEGEPSPEDIVEVVEQIEEKGITILYIEEYTDEDSVQSIVEATGVSTKILYTMEIAPKGEDENYLSIMNKNFENLEAGMSCSADA